ncbi:ABC transporter permease [Roseivirga sp. E12]|uniref:ABC transporter permease n=1 Tax=Roseivirga sp. E12 TaxID=2819237 RepID=UPI001ABC5AC2|nr:ABC transporter permease [Roseivirga sp. E12]MBO3700410.1 ABC transporter permease [Roseivirga sp. E12]
MLINMLTIAWRSATRHKQFTLLNILGLSIGITASLLIGLYVLEEMSYDNFHTKGDRIYRINQSMIWGDWKDEFGSTGPNLAVALRSDVPEFEEVTRLRSPGRQLVSYQADEGKLVSFRERGILIAEQNFFNIFSLPLLEGSVDQALLTPLSVVITEKMALKYFGDEEPIGKTLKIDEERGEVRSFIVTAVMANMPTNSHIQFDMLTSMSSYPNIKRREYQWMWTQFGTYGLVLPDTDIESLEAKIQAIPPKWAGVRALGKTFDEFVEGKEWSLFMQPIRDVYMQSASSGNRFGPSGDRVYVQIFGAVGLLILLLSSINFMNLSTARSANRAKEVGIRKTLGSPKRALIRQFMFESIMFVLVSTIIALVATEVSLSAFNTLANTSLSLYSKLVNPSFIALLGGFILFLGIATGSYPAFYLSSFNPIEVLKGKLSTGFKGKSVRNGLVVFQFTITIALIICALFVQKQLDYASNENLGFDSDNILQIHNIELLNSNNQETFQTLLKSNTAFEEIGLSDAVPPNIWGEDNYRPADDTENKGINLNRLRASEEYLNMLDLEFSTGRSFDKTLETDKYKIILNETAVRDFGWGIKENYTEDSPIGKQITFVDNNEVILFEVIGVVKDFNFNSVKYEIGPLLIVHEDNDLMWESGRDFISIRLNKDFVQKTSDLSALLKDVESKLSDINPGVPFEYSLMDQNFEAQFRTEQQMGQVLNVFTVMALSIACLGLFGLAAFSAEQRKKELGVRKILGASVYRLMYVFTAEFTVLVFIALLIASPLAYLFVKDWLTNFAYTTPITPVVFIGAAIGSLGLAWITIGLQSLRAANTNPVEVLRDE